MLVRLRDWLKKILTNYCFLWRQTILVLSFSIVNSLSDDTCDALEVGYRPYEL